MPILNTNDDRTVLSVLGQTSSMAMSTVRGERYRSDGKDNQDCIASFSSGEVTVDLVCDGLGGYADQNGELAARYCCEEAEKIVQKGFEKMSEEDIPPYMLKELLLQTTLRYTKEHLGTQAGTTLLLMITIGSHITVYHLGDSRAMFFTPDGNLITQTKDHKPPEYMHRFMLTRYLYQTDPDDLYSHVDELNIDLKKYPEGLIALLMSDGVTDNLKTSLEQPESHTFLSQLILEHQEAVPLCEAIITASEKRMDLFGSIEGKKLDVKPDNVACLVRWFSEK